MKKKKLNILYEDKFIIIVNKYITNIPNKNIFILITSLSIIII